MIKEFIKRYNFLFVLLFAFITTIILYGKFEGTESFKLFLIWAEKNILFLILSILLLKVIGIIWPPLPGLVFTIAAIPIIGWFPAFIVDFCGGILGSSIAFKLSRKYGPMIVVKLFGESGLAQVRRFKFKPNNELEAIILLRVFSGAIAEVISYGAGLTNLKFRNFLLGTGISYIVVGIPLFYLLGFAFSDGHLLFAIIPLVLCVILFYFTKGRYFIISD